MKTLLQLLLLIFIVACGKEPSVYKVDAEFKPYVENFQSSRSAVTGGASRIKNFELKFKDQTYLGLNVLGSCRVELRKDKSVWGSLSQKTYEVAVIEIDPEYWQIGQGLDIFADREQIINHEMGHCVLNQGHRNGVYVMNPYQLSTATYLSRYPSLITTLFKPTATSMAAVAYNQAAYVAASQASRFQTSEANQEANPYVVEESDFSDEEHEVLEVKESDSDCILHQH